MTVDRLPVLYPRPWDVKTELEQLYISLRREWGWLETAWIPDPRTLNPGTCRNCGLALATKTPYWYCMLCYSLKTGRTEVQRARFQDERECARPFIKLRAAVKRDIRTWLAVEKKWIRTWLAAEKSWYCGWLQAERSWKTMQQNRWIHTERRWLKEHGVTGFDCEFCGHDVGFSIRNRHKDGTPNSAQHMCLSCRHARKKCPKCGVRFLPEKWDRQCPECRVYSMGPYRRRYVIERQALIWERVPKVAPKIQVQGLPCVYCGAPAQHADHIVPLSRGWWDYSTNLVPSCKPCNVHKHARLLSEWDNKKVARAVSVSPKVAMAYLIEVLGIGRPVLVPIPTDEQVLAAYPPRKYVKEEVSA